MTTKTALIIGGGPAGLTAAYELVTHSDVKPVIFEASDDVGGIARTFEHNGNRIDLGGHRFFSKSDRVMDWWREVLPLQRHVEGADSRIEITYQRKTRMVDLPADGPDPDQTDEVMLLRQRVSRILFGGKFYDYPLSLSMRTLLNLGPLATLRIGFSYLRARLFPRRPEATLEDFIVNRFGRELYATFFEAYTEKVWGVPCREISAEWGAQRIKGLSITRVLLHAVKSLLPRRASIAQKDTETSLIEQFMYPKYGPGLMWETVTRMIRAQGAEIHFMRRITGLEHDGARVTAAIVEGPDGARERVEADYFFSTMAIRDLVAGLSPAAPAEVAEVGGGLIYRDFMTVGLLVERLKLGGGVTGRALAEAVPDNWIYVQERDVKVGRLQIFNNWSPYMVADPDLIWIGLEYFCDEGDALWTMADDAMIDFAVDELARINVIERDVVRDAVVIRQLKAYPAYFGTYDRFDVVRDYFDGFENLFLIGRNGMHRYNNQDHSMLAAMVAVENLLAGRTDKSNIWDVNTELEYHEEK